MRWKQFEPLRPFAALGIFLLVWWGSHSIVRSVFRSVLYEIQAPVWVGPSYVADLQVTLSGQAQGKKRLLEEIRDLRRLNAAYQLRAQQADALEGEIRRLEAFLNLPTIPGFRTEVARVIRRDLNQWWQRVVIRKGARDGMLMGAPVLFDGGVVGRVVAVHAYTSEVELVTSTRFRMVAHFEGDSRPVTFEGSGGVGFSLPGGRVHTVPSDIAVPPGGRLRLVSSSLGGVFPAGLTIGFVDVLEVGGDGIFLAGTVHLSERLLALQEVAVVLRESLLDSRVSPEGSEVDQ